MTPSSLGIQYRPWERGWAIPVRRGSSVTSRSCGAPSILVVRRFAGWNGAISMTVRAGLVTGSPSMKTRSLSGRSSVVCTLRSSRRANDPRSISTSYGDDNAPKVSNLFMQHADECYNHATGLSSRRCEAAGSASGGGLVVLRRVRVPNQSRRPREIQRRSTLAGTPAW